MEINCLLSPISLRYFSIIFPRVFFAKKIKLIRDSLFFIRYCAKTIQLYRILMNSYGLYLSQNMKFSYIIYVRPYSSKCLRNSYNMHQQTVQLSPLAPVRLQRIYIKKKNKTKNTACSICWFLFICLYSYIHIYCHYYIYIV